MDGDVKCFRATARTRSTHRRGIMCIGADRHTHIALVDTNAIGRIKADPAEALDVGLGPGVARRLLGGLMQKIIAADITGRNIKNMGATEKHLRKILTDANAVFPCLRGAGER